MIDAQQIKKDFPIFQNNPGLTYLDSSVTSLKPKRVIDKLDEYYQEYSANIHRGIYKIAEKATAEYEATRDVVSQFIHANRREEVVFTRGTTEALNLIAYSLGRQIVGSKDEVVTSIMEHHSNFVPWQVLAGEVGADFKVIDVDEEGRLRLKIKDQRSKNKKTSQNLEFNALEEIITPKTKILALTYVSNTLGVINPIKEIIYHAKKINPKLIAVIDAAQAIPHMKVDVQDLGCDFLVFSSHKMLGPTGVGVLWGKYELLDQMYPFQYGGEMIDEVSVERTTFKKPPYKFEAGTPNIADVIALKEAIYYINTIGLDEIHEYEKQLTAYALKTLRVEFDNKIRLLGPKDLNHKAGIISFVFDTYHAHDVAQILDEQNIAIRAGHHCTMPLHTRYNIAASARVSLYIYNDKSDIDKLVEGLKKVEKTLK